MSIVARLPALLAVVAWATLALQFALSLRLAQTNGHGVATGVLVYLGFFTILSNLAGALALTLPRAWPASAAGRFFAQPGVNTAIAAYLAVVGIAYSLLLRQTWNPQGWQLVADHLLHDVMPPAFLAYWWFAIDKRGVAWRDVPYWLIFPVVYFAAMLARGGLTGSYPYPFVDAGKLGVAQATVNALGVLAAMATIAALLVALSRLQTRRAASGAAGEARVPE